MNDGPTCRCSNKAKRSGIRHGYYQGENEKDEVNLEDNTNNSDKLHHYRIIVTPPTNYLVEHPTMIDHDGHNFVFEGMHVITYLTYIIHWIVIKFIPGFSLFTKDALPDLPVCKVVRFNIEYSILYFEEKIPDNFTLKELKLFHDYLFKELLELVDWDINDRFYFMPR